MSQYHVSRTHSEPAFTVGWDAPMNTFFFHIEDEAGDIVVERGTLGDQLYTLDDLLNAMKEADVYDVPDELQARLYGDRDMGVMNTIAHIER